MNRCNNDEIYVNDPVLRVVEQESLYWMTGRLSAEVRGEAWARELRHFPNLEQVARDGGKGLEKGVALVNAERQAQDKPLVVDQGDPWHALRGGSVGLRQAERQAREALAKAEEADQELAACDRQGHKRTGPAVRASAAWRKAEQAMDIGCERERLWQKTKEALRLFTPEGQWNTRQQAEAVLAQTLPQLPDTFAKAKRHLHKPELLNSLDQLQRQLEALPFPQEVKQAAVRQGAAYAAGSAPEDDPKPLGPQTVTLELPHLSDRSPSQNYPLPTPGTSLARRSTLVGCAQTNI